MDGHAHTDMRGWRGSLKTCLQQLVGQHQRHHALTVSTSAFVPPCCLGLQSKQRNEMREPCEPGSPPTCSSWSASTRATLLSTMGAARGTTQGSCRPRASSSTSCPSRDTVCCRRAMVAVGLKATRMTMLSPLLMPPCTPPDLQRGNAGGGGAACVGMCDRACVHARTPHACMPA